MKFKILRSGTKIRRVQADEDEKHILLSSDRGWSPCGGAIVVNHGITAAPPPSPFPPGEFGLFGFVGPVPPHSYSRGTPGNTNATAGIMIIIVQMMFV